MDKPIQGNYSLIQHFILIASPVLVVPFTIFGLENGFDYVFNKKVVKGKWNRTNGKIVGAGIVKLNGKNKEFPVDYAKLKTNFFYVPKITFEYVVDGKKYRSTHAFYKRNKFRNLNRTKNFLSNTLKELKNGDEENQNDVTVEYSHGKKSSVKNIGRILNPHTGELLGYSSERALRYAYLNAIGLGGVCGILGVSYFTAHKSLQEMARRFFGYSVMINTIVIGFMLSRRYFDDIGRRYSTEITQKEDNDNDEDNL